MSAATFEGIFRRKQNILEEKLDIDNGLLGKLEADEVITRRLRSVIEVSCIPADK